MQMSKTNDCKYQVFLFKLYIFYKLHRHMYKPKIQLLADNTNLLSSIDTAIDK